MAHRSRTVRRLALAGLVVAATGVARPAFATDDGYQNVFTSVLTAVGVMSADKGPALEAGVEPDRLYLTQPPKGYLKVTKVVKATNEAPVVKRDDSSPLSTYIAPNMHKDDPLQ